MELCLQIIQEFSLSLYANSQHQRISPDACRHVPLQALPKRTLHWLLVAITLIVRPWRQYQSPTEPPDQHHVGESKRSSLNNLGPAKSFSGQQYLFIPHCLDNPLTIKFSDQFTERAHEERMLTKIPFELEQSDGWDPRPSVTQAIISLSRCHPRWKIKSYPNFT